jgi:hypothetical protein
MTSHGTAMMTQLLLEHALRMRVKAEIDSSSSSSGVEGTEEKKKNSANLTGKLNNLVTSDMDKLEGIREMINILFQAPLSLAVGTFILYSILGWR